MTHLSHICFFEYAVCLEAGQAEICLWISMLVIAFLYEQVCPHETPCSTLFTMFGQAGICLHSL